MKHIYVITKNKGHMENSSIYLLFFVKLCYNDGKIGSGFMHKDLKQFIIELISKKEEENDEFVKYTFYELRVKYNLTEQEVNQVLKISKDYFENKGYKVYFTGARFEYQNANRMVQDNELMIAIRE